jgi:hypothetical protein
MTKPWWVISCAAMGSSAMIALTIAMAVFRNQTIQRSPIPASQQHDCARAYSQS